MLDKILEIAAIALPAVISFLAGAKLALSMVKDKTESKLDDKAYSVISAILFPLEKLDELRKKK